MAAGRGTRPGIRSIAWLGAVAISWPCMAAGSDGPGAAVVDTAIAASNREADAFVEALGEPVRGLGLAMRVERRQDPPTKRPMTSSRSCGSTPAPRIGSTSG